MKTIKFHFYEGKSLVSRLIKWRTYSIYSHVSIQIDNEIIESWVGGGQSGVVISTDPLTYHKKGTNITTIEIEMKNWKPWLVFLKSQIGKKYDYKAILNFVKNKTKQNPNRWFCSELANTFFEFELKNYKNNRLVSPQSFYDTIKTYSLLQKHKEV